ncbi:MAG: hypothetical protein ABSA16_16165 [Thermoguttaceae bacterium]|jgi:hypothetical protein
MFEQTKIDEARYFLSKMEVSLNDRKSFCYELSAFLSASRSVLQYVFEEVGGNTGSKPRDKLWYDTQVANNPIFKFFKDKRDVSVHETPVSPTAIINISVTHTLHISDSVAVEVQDKDLKIVPEATITPTPPTGMEPQPVSASYEYNFPDWAGPEDVLILCKKYLDELDIFIKDGIGQGFLSKA